MTAKEKETIISMAILTVYNIAIIGTVSNEDELIAVMTTTLIMMVAVLAVKRKRDCLFSFILYSVFNTISLIAL